jgi:sugar phosphate permease
MDLDKIKPTAAIVIALSLSPAFEVMLLMFMNDRNFFLTTDTTKLIILTIGITIPLMVVSMFTCGVLIKEGIGDADENNGYVTSLAGLVTSTILGFSIVLKFIVPTLPVSIQIMVYSAISFLLLFYAFFK